MSQENPTFKGEFDTVGERVFYTLLPEEYKLSAEHLPTFTIAKLLGLLVDRMVERGELSEDELDDLLMRTLY